MKKGGETAIKCIPILFILLLFLAQIAGAVDYPQLTEHITDNANIIDDNYEQLIKELAESIEKNTRVEIAVLTIEFTGSA